VKILVDENIPTITVEELRRRGNEVLDIRGTSSQGMPDAQLWADKGFADHRDDAHHGILIIRLRQPNENRIHTRIISALDQYPEESWPGMLVVMRDNVQSVSRR